MSCELWKQRIGMISQIAAIRHGLTAGMRQVLPRRDVAVRVDAACEQA